MNSVAQKVVAERFGEKKIERDDMLGSFVRHGLTQQECESESLLQMYVGLVSSLPDVDLFLLAWQAQIPPPRQCEVPSYTSSRILPSTRN